MIARQVFDREKAKGKKKRKINICIDLFLVVDISRENSFVYA